VGHQNFQGSTIKDYFTNYSRALSESLNKIDPQGLELALIKIKDAMNAGRQIFVAGNGGSAAISDHLCCDFSKGTFAPPKAPLRTHSLSANSALVTALGNDIGYEHIFSHQLKILAQKGDLAILISSSGNSPNIINAAKIAKEINVTTVGLTGFSGGDVVPLLDVHIHVPIHNYGVVEDCHQSVMHILSQFINHERENR
jgi:phosphoheptose isomerase